MPPLFSDAHTLWLQALAGGPLVLTLGLAAVLRPFCRRLGLGRAFGLWVLLGLAVSGGLAALAVLEALPTLAIPLGLALVALHGAFVRQVLQQLERAERLARARLDDEAARREVAERDSVQLRQSLAEREALAQRDALATERSRLLRVMAHEVRQPLHSAGAALQAVRQQLGAGVAADPVVLRRDMDRADQVLATVRDVLDNVLGAAQLIDRAQPLRPGPADLGFLLQMTVLDLPEQLRARVRLPPPQALRPLCVEPNLFRLALRNLLRNAFQHGGATGEVTLSLIERAAGGELGVAVGDQGPGMPLAQRQARQRAAAEWPAPAEVGAGRGQGLGLGLQIAQRVASLHGGRLELQAVEPQGLLAVLWFAAPAPARSALSRVPAGP